MKKKLFSLFIAAGMILGLGLEIPSANNTTAEAAGTGEYNYGEALQKSMFFYEAQQCGEIPDWNNVSWRDDSMTTDYISGGWFDAGDHLKFTLTNAYSAALLGWGLLQYPNGAEKSGLANEYKLNLKWALDYVANCDLGNEVVYMIGDGAFDHVWWGSAEVYMLKYQLKGGEAQRPYFTTKNSSVTGQMAAALAVGAMVFKDSDPTLANSYLDHAKNCFKIADTNRAIGGDSAETSYYNCSSFYDDLFYAANFLYMATGDKSYLDLCKSDYIPNLPTEQQSTEMKFTWGYCWDDVMQPAILLYAMNTGDQTWKTQIQKHLDYWTVGYGGKQVSYTPDGLAWLFQWGSLRHATTTAFLANVAADNLFKDDATLYKRYTDFADKQMNYCFGDNTNNFSYVIGMGETYPKAWHHRTSSGVWDDQWTMLGDTKEYAHVLYGALVGGPDQSGKYTDRVDSYQNSEVAIDYNAGYTAALCAMTQKYGGTSDSSFPPKETPKWDEFYIAACINQASASYTEIKVQATNHSAWPARVIKNISYNYYMDLTELFDAGLTVNDITTKIGYDEFSNCTISKPIQYSGNIYYVKITYADGTKIMPTGQSEHQGEVQFRVSIPDPKPIWDAKNDYSFNGLVQQDLTVTKNITMYDGDKLIWGTEPDGTTPSQDPIVTPLPGDVNCDKTVDVKDLSMLSKFIVGLPSIAKEGSANADMNKDGKVNVIDLLLLCRKIIGM